MKSSLTVPVLPVVFGRRIVNPALNQPLFIGDVCISEDVFV
jgi:hypothetical protein